MMSMAYNVMHLQDTKQEEKMSSSNNLTYANPIAPLKIIALPGCEHMAAAVNKYLKQFRKELLEENPSKR